MPDDFRLYAEQETLPEEQLPITAVELRYLADLFMQHFTRYLTGNGHPNFAIYNKLISKEKRDEAAADQTFRARNFLHQMTGMNCLESRPVKLQARISLVACLSHSDTSC